MQGSSRTTVVTFTPGGDGYAGGDYYEATMDQGATYVATLYERASGGWGVADDGGPWGLVPEEDHAAYVYPTLRHAKDAVLRDMGVLPTPRGHSPREPLPHTGR